MKKLQDTAHELDSIRGGLLLHAELLGDVLNELGDFSEDVSNTKREDVMHDWDRIQRKVRLLHKITTHTFNEYQRDFVGLEEITDSLFREVHSRSSAEENTKKA